MKIPTFIKNAAMAVLVMSAIAVGYLHRKGIERAAVPVVFAQTDQEPAEDDRGPSAEGVAEFLESRGAHDLAVNAVTIMTFSRWDEALAIAGAETSFCTAGVGSSRDNCGAIKNASGEFKIYASPVDGVEDISILLGKPRYASSTIAEMNGTYCVDDVHGECPGWTERVSGILKKIQEIR